MLTAEQEKAVYEVFSSRGVRTSMGAEWEMRQAQQILGTGDQLSPHRQEIFEAILKAVGMAPVAPDRTPAPRSRASAAPTASAPSPGGPADVLGIDVGGAIMTVDSTPAGVNPVDYLRSAVTLTATGRAVVESLSALPQERAKALAVDTAVITAYAKKAGLDSAVCLAAEIGRIDQLQKDMAILSGSFGPGGGPAAPAQTRILTSPAPSPAPAPAASTVADQLARDRKIMRDLGL